jgi:hypothetical protein
LEAITGLNLMRDLGIIQQAEYSRHFPTLLTEVLLHFNRLAREFFYTVMSKLLKK